MRGMNYFTDWLDSVDQLIWGPILVGFLIGVGLYLTFLLRGLQFRSFWHALKLIGAKQNPPGKGDLTPFQALTTALAGTVGTGNIAGVATAILIGGVGSIFWLWVSGLVGMIITYAEAVLAVRFRIIGKKGEISGGPMYYIANGLGWRWLAILFAIFGACASLFGIGNLVQSHSIADVLSETFLLPPIWTGLIISSLIALILIGGIKSIGKVTSLFVPAMALFYLIAGIGILVIHATEIPAILRLIVSSAFNGQAAIGGFVGSTGMMALRMGISRGIFSNEAGMGSTSIAAAAAITNSPTRQGLISMVGTFVDTVIICSVTGLTIALTGSLGVMNASGAPLNGAPLTAYAFASSIPGGGYLVASCLVLFAFSTILAWSYYGEKCLEFLFGSKTRIPYRIIFVLLIIAGSVLPLETVWSIADIANGLMAIPNLIALLLLSGVVLTETRLYRAKIQQTLEL